MHPLAMRSGLGWGVGENCSPTTIPNLTPTPTFKLYQQTESKFSHNAETQTTNENLNIHENNFSSLILAELAVVRERQDHMDNARQIVIEQT